MLYKTCDIGRCDHGESEDNHFIQKYVNKINTLVKSRILYTYTGLRKNKIIVNTQEL